MPATRHYFNSLINFLSEKRFALLTILLLLINVGQKLYYIKYHSIWGDEAYTLWFGLHPLNEMLNSLTDGNDAPVYFLLMHFYIKLFGISNFAVRFLSVLFNTASLAIICLIAKKFVNIRFAFYSAILFMASSILLHYALEVRPYALATFLASCSLYLYLSLYKDSSKNGITAVVLGLVNTLMFYTHYVTAVFIFVQVLLIPFLLKFSKRKYYKFIISYLITALCTLPYVLMLIPRLGGMRGSWQQIPDLKELWQNLVLFSQGAWLLYIYLLLLAFALVLVFIKKYRSSTPTYKHIYIIFLACYALPVVLIYFISLYSPIFILRYFLYACLCFYLAIAFAYDLVPLPNWIKIIAAVYFAYRLFLLMDINPYTNEDWKSAMPVINKYRLEKEVIFIEPFYEIGTFAYHYRPSYFKDYVNTKQLLKLDNIFGVDNSDDIKNKLENRLTNRIILVQTQWTVTDPNNTAQKFLDSAYTKIDSADYTGIKLSIYDQK